MSHLIEYNVYINKTYISFKIVKKKYLTIYLNIGIMKYTRNLYCFLVDR
jgi:hypothetical protein